jgi:hypothetical protein
MEAYRLVLRASPSAAKELDIKSDGNAPAQEPPVVCQAHQAPIPISSGTPIAVRSNGSSRATRRAKPAGTLGPGDAIRLETGERVVITYVSVGFRPTDRYIEWGGAPRTNWANVPADEQVILA